jgi:hypothetical protein
MNAVSSQSATVLAASATQDAAGSDIKFCAIDEPDCEDCQ